MVAGLLLAAGAVFFATHNKPLTAEEALLLKNVEALADNENNDNIGFEATLVHYKRWDVQLQMEVTDVKWECVRVSISVSCRF